MNDSILITIKKLIGLDPEDESFNTDLLVNINSAIDVLRQLGVSIADGFTVEDDSTTWEELIPEGMSLHQIRSYLCMKVRKWFDPPQNGTTMDALNTSIAELEWRINVTVDPERVEDGV